MEQFNKKELETITNSLYEYLNDTTYWLSKARERGIKDSLKNYLEKINDIQHLISKTENLIENIDKYEKM